MARAIEVHGVLCMVFMQLLPVKFKEKASTPDISVAIRPCIVTGPLPASWIVACFMMQYRAYVLKNDIL